MGRLAIIYEGPTATEKNKGSVMIVLFQAVFNNSFPANEAQIQLATAASGLLIGILSGNKDPRTERLFTVQMRGTEKLLMQLSVFTSSNHLPYRTSMYPFSSCKMTILFVTLDVFDILLKL